MTKYKIMRHCWEIMNTISTKHQLLEKKRVTLLNARLEIACGINVMRHQREKKIKIKKIVAPKNKWVSSWINQKQQLRKKIGTKILPSIEPSHKHTKKNRIY